MRKSIRLAIDHEVDMPLRPALDVLAAMRAGPAKTKLAEQRREVAGFFFADGEFDEADATAFRFRLQRHCRTARRRRANIIFEPDERAQPVGRGADRGAG